MREKIKGITVALLFGFTLLGIGLAGGGSSLVGAAQAHDRDWDRDRDRDHGRDRHRYTRCYRHWDQWGGHRMRCFNYQGNYWRWNWQGW